MRWIGRIALWALVLVVMTFIMINVHEIGHTITARLAGDSTASYHLYQRYPSGGHCIGCNVYDAKLLTPTGVLWVSLGGVLATQLAAIMALVFLFQARSVVAKGLLVM